MEAAGAHPPDPRHPRRCFRRPRWGKREIASLASGALSSEGKTAEITGIEGFPPFDVRVDRVRLGDPQGHWLEVDGARFHLVPSAALRLKVEIATVRAERVAPRPTTAISGTNRPPLKMNAEQKDLAARLLAEGKSVKEAAKTFGVHVSTIYRLSDVGVV